LAERSDRFAIRLGGMRVETVGIGVTQNDDVLDRGWLWLGERWHVGTFDAGLPMIYSIPSRRPIRNTP
jgi:hypothetical protein